jgi:CheY-like chemotaxis protein
MVLEVLGYTVFAAATAAEAIHLFRATDHEISLIISDVMMRNERP